MTEKMRNFFGRISPTFAAMLGIGVLSAGILLCGLCAYAQEETDDEIFLNFEKTYIGRFRRTVLWLERRELVMRKQPRKSCGAYDRGERQSRCPSFLRYGKL